MIQGSCLCGGVRFAFPRALTPIGSCHCSPCREVSPRFQERPPAAGPGPGESGS
jgi:hypothetical protein